MNKKYGIVGWSYVGKAKDNLLFGGVTFDTFEEGWDWIYVNHPEPEQDSPDWVCGWYDDWYVVELEQD
mgnify:CR=1 FL=1